MLSMSHRAPGYRLNSQVPPTFAAFSSTRVRSPSCRSRCSMYRPENPAPMTRTSKRALSAIAADLHLAVLPGALHFAGLKVGFLGVREPAVAGLEPPDRIELVSRLSHLSPCGRTVRTAEIYTVMDLVSTIMGAPA